MESLINFSDSNCFRHLLLDKWRYTEKGFPYTIPVPVLLSKHLLLSAVSDETGLHEFLA